MNKCESQVGVCLVKIYLEVLLLIYVTHPIYLGRDACQLLLLNPLPPPPEKADMRQEASARGLGLPL